MNQFNNWLYHFHCSYSSRGYESRLAGQLNAGSRAGRSRTAGWTYSANWAMSATSELCYRSYLATRFGRTQS